MAFFHHDQVQATIVQMQGQRPPSFLTTKSKVASAEEEEGPMKPAARGTEMCFCMAASSGADREKI